MKLNIYEKRQVVKTYTADTYDLMFGTLEDVAAAMNLDQMTSGDEKEILSMAMNLLQHGTHTVRDLLKDIFEGITDEEIKHTRVKEIAKVLLDVVKYTAKELGKMNTEKN